MATKSPSPISRRRSQRFPRILLFQPRLEILEERRLMAIFVVTNTDDSGAGSLRQAILDANANPGTDTIAFNIGGGGVQTIQPISALPTISDPVVIDGTTQPGFAGSPLIVLNGGMAGGGVSGLIITAGYSTVQGLVVNGFGGDGIDLQINGSNNVNGNLIGTDATGTHAVGNGGSGLSITSSNNLIGGTSAGYRNVISGNSNGNGIWIAASGTVVQGNLIGTNAEGNAPLPNGTGVLINASNNTIGGMTPGAGNVISGNNYFGIGMGVSNNNIVEGNRIGTDVTGTRSLVNGFYGVEITASTGNVIGGTAAGARNVISGSNFGAVSLSENAQGNRVQGNYIGTDVSGTHALGGIGVAIQIFGNDNVIGGTEAGAGNLVADFGEGVEVAGGGGNQIQGNRIGTDVSGTAALGNGTGVLLASGATGNVVGGTEVGAGNVISGNRNDGIFISGSASTGNRVSGNFIGTDVSGDVPLGNGGDGVRLQGVSGNTIGGTIDGARNLISGNAGNGIHIFGGSGDTVRGNTIAHNASDGVLVDSGMGNEILRNAIVGHDKGLGIELLNGGNHDQEYPEITSAFSGGGFTTIEGILFSAPSTTFTLEFFVNSLCNPSGFGEGEQFLASITVHTDLDGNASFALTVGISVDLGTFISATTTDPGGNTSEFSQCAEVTGPNFPG
ncbi:MAG TPA: right-handed parallel beta-helix repeat-containing protein, partial [Gemmataceae bacterium]|nr:right-handed parallel beta-helix repeat-containing protein [Gemmataceae bacterium]